MEQWHEILEEVRDYLPEYSDDDLHEGICVRDVNEANEGITTYFKEEVAY